MLLAIGRPHEVAHGSLRLSLGEENTGGRVDYILREVPRGGGVSAGACLPCGRLETGTEAHLDVLKGETDYGLYSDKVMDHFQQSPERGRDCKTPTAWARWATPSAATS